MSTLVRSTTIYGQVVIEMNVRCSKCSNLVEWKDGNFCLNEIIIEPCQCLNLLMEDNSTFDINKSICELNWEVGSGSVRIINCLRSENIITVKDVLQISRCYLRKIPNFGMKSLLNLENELKKIGFKLNNGSFSDTIHTKYEIKRI